MAEKVNPQVQIMDIVPDNADHIGLYCVKDKKSEGFKRKLAWFLHETRSGLRIKVSVDGQGRQLGFIEYMPSEHAWRPVRADHYLFIQCIAVIFNENRDLGIATALIMACEDEAIRYRKNGICTIVSDGAWIADRRIFVKYGFHSAGRLERFELLYKKFNEECPVPYLHDWTEQQAAYQGWNLVYADQCPWHEKSVHDLQRSAKEHGIDLKVRKLLTPAEAQKGPSGTGTFALVRDGKLLADHYISATRFINILKKESL